MRNHIKGVHLGIKVSKCNLCDKEFSSKPYLLLHVKSVHEKINPKCELCNKYLSKDDKLKNHMKLHTEYRKSLAHKNQKNKISRLIDDKSKAQIDVMKYELCKKVIKKNAAYLKHMKWHDDEKSLKCKDCLKTFTTNLDLATHEKIHKKHTNPKTCDSCGKYFASKGSLQRHSKEIHQGIRKSQARCELCGKELSSKTYLELHVKSVHKKEKQFQCDICNKLYSSKSHLNTHKKQIHTEESLARCYQCDSCDKKFKSNGMLKVHKDSHEGKRHKCNQCELTFGNAPNLRRHFKKVHAGENYKCDICGKEVSDKDYLKKHIQTIHHGLKEHLCNLCNLSFARSHHLQGHVTKVHA